MSTASLIRPSGQAGSGSPARARRTPPPDHDLAVADRVIQRTVAAVVPGGQRQARQRPHRPVRAQHRIGQLEQLITASGQAGTQIHPEPRQHGQGLDIGGTLSKLFITAFVVIMCPLARTDDHVEAAGGCTCAPGTPWAASPGRSIPWSGWMQYYGAFYRSVLLPVLRRINAYLTRWLRKKY